MFITLGGFEKWEKSIYWRGQEIDEGDLSWELHRNI